MQRNTGLKALAGTAILAAGMTLAGSQAGAVELWNPHLMGLDGGSAAGALPPEGVYFLNSFLYMTSSSYGSFDGSVSGGSKNGNKATVEVDVPILLWSTGYKVLGADYAVGIAQPIDHVDFGIGGSSPGNTTYSHGDPFATVLIPYILSWGLTENIKVSTGLLVYMPDGTYQDPSKHTLGQLNSLDFFSFEPSVGVSWLKDGWNASLKLWYDANLKNLDNDFQSGDTIGTEWTLAKTVGKWTYGLNAFTKDQVTDDTGTLNGVIYDGHRQHNYGIGPLVGYNFGPVTLDLRYYHNIATENDIGGDLIYTDLVIPLY
jgi:hypothetical protein